MTKKEIIAKIDEIKTYAFYLNMKDRWDTKDYATMRRYDREIKKLEEMLEMA